LAAAFFFSREPPEGIGAAAEGTVGFDTLAAAAADATVGCQGTSERTDRQRDRETERETEKETQTERKKETDRQ
jgi:hypothetical protein